MYKKFLRTSLVLVGLLSLSSTLVSASAPADIPTLSQANMKKLKTAIETWDHSSDRQPECPGATHHLNQLADVITWPKKTEEHKKTPSVAVASITLAYGTHQKGMILITKNGGFKDDKRSGSYMKDVNEECREQELIDSERYRRWETLRHAGNVGRHHFGDWGSDPSFEAK